MVHKAVNFTIIRTFCSTFVQNSKSLWNPNQKSSAVTDCVHGRGADTCTMEVRSLISEKLSALTNRSCCARFLQNSKGLWKSNEKSRLVAECVRTRKLRGHMHGGVSVAYFLDTKCSFTLRLCQNTNSQSTCSHIEFPECVQQSLSWSARRVDCRLFVDMQNGGGGLGDEVFPARAAAFCPDAGT